ncbi:MAG: hypothetical protein ACYDAJ_02615 [Nitrosotalea sp.]
MSKEQPEINAETKPEPEVLDAGITKKSEPKESEVVASALPEAPDKVKQIQDLLDIKKGMGLNLSDKETYVRIYKEIAEQVGCSYQLVAKTAKKHLNASQAVIKESVVADKSKINIKGVGDDTRPPPKVLPKEAMSAPAKALTPEQKQESDKTKIEFETGMILMSFENIAGFQDLALGISPKSKKMQQMALRIATYNHMMRENGTPEECINVGDKLMKYMLWAGIAGLFLTPLGMKVKQLGDKKSSGITPKKETRSMR